MSLKNSSSVKKKTVVKEKKEVVSSKPHETDCQILTISLKRNMVKFIDSEAKNAAISRSYFINIYLEKGLNESKRWHEYKANQKENNKERKESNKEDI